MFKSKGRQGAHLAIELEQRFWLLYPNLLGNADAPQPVMRGFVVLTLSKPKRFDNITVSLIVVSRSKLPKQSHTKQLPIWHQEFAILEEEKEIPAGEHRFPFAFALENCAAPDVELTRKHWQLQIKKDLQVKASLAGKPDLEASLDTRAFAIHTNAYNPNEYPELYNSIERHTEPGIGLFAFDFDAPAATVGNSLRVKLHFEADENPVRFLTISGAVEQRIVWHSADEDNAAEPIIERIPIFQLLPSGGTVVQPAASLDIEKLTRFPDHDAITASSETGSETSLNAAHDLLIEVLAVVNSSPRKFSIRRQLHLAGCTLIPDTVVLPTYDVALSSPSIERSAVRSDDKANLKNTCIRCVCTTTKEILDADLAEMSRADGQSFAALVKQENERLGLSGRETPLFFGTPSREMSPVPFEEYQSQPGTSDGKS